MLVNLQDFYFRLFLANFYRSLSGACRSSETLTNILCRILFCICKLANAYKTWGLAILALAQSTLWRAVALRRQQRVVNQSTLWRAVALRRQQRVVNQSALIHRALWGISALIHRVVNQSTLWRAIALRRHQRVVNRPLYAEQRRFIGSRGRWIRALCGVTSSGTSQASEGHKFWMKRISMRYRSPPMASVRWDIAHRPWLQCDEISLLAHGFSAHTVLFFCKLGLWNVRQCHYFYLFHRFNFHIRLVGQMNFILIGNVLLYVSK